MSNIKKTSKKSKVAKDMGEPAEQYNTEELESDANSDGNISENNSSSHHHNNDRVEFVEAEVIPIESHKHTADGQEVTDSSLEDCLESRQLNNEHVDNDPQSVHNVNQEQAHFVPILHKSSAPNKPIEKQARSTPVDSIQSQDKPIEISVIYPVQLSAANSQQQHVSQSDSSLNQQSPLRAQPEKDPQSAQQVGWNCFDVAIDLANILGISTSTPEEQAYNARAELVKRALDHSEDLEYRNLLAPEIRHAAGLTVTAMNSGNATSTDRYLLPLVMRNDELKTLCNNYINADNDVRVKVAVAACNDQLGNPENQRKPYGDLEKYFQDADNRQVDRSAYEAFNQAQQIVKKAYEEFNEYCSRESTYREYVREYYGKNEWFTFQGQCSFENSTSMVDITAKLLGHKIIIYDLSQQKITHKTADYDSVIWVDYNGSNHFSAKPGKIGLFEDERSSLKRSPESEQNLSSNNINKHKSLSKDDIENEVLEQIITPQQASKQLLIAAKEEKKQDELSAIAHGADNIYPVQPSAASSSQKKLARQLGNSVNQKSQTLPVQPEKGLLSAQQVSWNSFDIAIDLANILGIPIITIEEQANQAMEAVKMFISNNSKNLQYRYFPPLDIRKDEQYNDYINSNNDKKVKDKLAIDLVENLGLSISTPEEQASKARQALVMLALNNSDDLEYRNLLAPEIRHAARLTFTAMNSGNIVSTDSYFLPLDMRNDKLKKLYNQVINQAFNQTQQIVKKAKEDFSEYCSRKNIYRQYIQEHYGNNKCFSFKENHDSEHSSSMVDITAKLLGRKIIVYDLNGKIIHKTADYGPEIQVSYNKSINHFSEKRFNQEDSIQLLIKAEEENEELVKNVLSAIASGANINYRYVKSKQSWIDIAWENSFYDVMLVLLKADSNFPSDFTLDLDALYEDDEIPDEIKTYVKEMEKFHTWVKEDNSEEIKKFVSKHKELNFFVNSKNETAVEVAAEHGFSDTLLTLLRIPFSMSDNKGDQLLLKSGVQFKLLNQSDDNGDTLLLKSIKNEKNLVDFFFRCGVNLNYRNKNYKSAIELAWENNNYSAVLSLLNCNSAFPIIEDKPFKLENIPEDDKVPEELKDFLRERQTWFNWIKNNDLTDKKKEIELEKIIPFKQTTYFKHTESKDEILGFLLKIFKFDVYAFLQSKNMNFSNEEKNSNYLKSLNDQQKDELQKEIHKHFTPTKDAHILLLIFKSQNAVPLSEEEFKEKVKKWYEELNKIPEVSIVLQVITARYSRLERIVFDFNRKSVIGMCVTSHTVEGVTDYQAGCIYLGALCEENEILGNLAHELGHFAMRGVFENEFKPYSKHDNEWKEEFKNISNNIHNKIKNSDIDLDPIIKYAFKNYSEEVCHSELIVRVPHILAKYGREEGIKILEKTEETKKLLNYYKEKVVVSYKKFIREQRLIHPRSNLALLIPYLGVSVIDKIREIDIEFEMPIDINSFLANNKNYLLVETKSLWLSVCSIYQSLQSLNLNENSYLFIKEKQLKKVIFDIFETNAFDKLVILSSDSLNKDRLLNKVKDLDKILKIKPNKKVILITNNNNKFKENENFQQIVYEIKFSNLNAKSQLKILNKMANFQGVEVTLNQLMTQTSPITELLPLADLLDGKRLDVGKPLPISKGYDKALYIGRAFHLYIKIEKSILNDEELSNSLTFSEEDFQILCQEYPKRNIYLLKNEAGGQPLILQRSQGKLTQLNKHIDKKYHSCIDIHRRQYYTPADLNNFLQKAPGQTVMLIADTSGMGKSTVLTHLSQEIKRINPTSWVVRIDLNDHTKVLKKRTETDRKMENIDFLSEKLLKLDSPLEKNLFKQRLDEGKVVLMLDGFDEISPNYNDTVIDLLQALKNTKVEQLWVTTRPHLSQVLEDKLQTLSFNLEPFSEENQVEFITKFWRQNNNLNIESQPRLEIYAVELIECLARSIKDKEKEFTGIPLQSFMLAEAYQEKAMVFLTENKNASGLPNYLDLADLYYKFIEHKVDVFSKEKITPTDGNLALKQRNKFDMDGINFREIHQKLALQFLIPEQKIIDDIFTELKRIKLPSPEQLIRIGIVRMSKAGDLHFIHRTFAEYYAADFLVSQLKEQTENERLIKFLLSQILLQPDYQVIRSFLNSELIKNRKDSEKIDIYGKQVSELWLAGYLYIKRESYLEIAADEGNAEIIKFLHSNLKMHPSTLKEIADNSGGSALDKAAAKGDVNFVKIFLESMEVVERKQPGIINSLVLNKDLQFNMLYKAIVYEQWNFIQLILEYLKNNNYFSDDELKKLILKDTFLLCKKMPENHMEWFLKYVEKNFGVNFLKEFILYTHQTTILHHICTHTIYKTQNNKVPEINILELLFNFIEKFEILEPDSLRKFILAADTQNKTMLDYAAGETVELCKWILEYVKYNFENTLPGTLKSFILSRNGKGEYFIHRAVRYGNIELVKYLLNYIKDNFEDASSDILKAVLLSNTSSTDENLIHYAVRYGKIELVKYLLNYIKDNFEGASSDILKVVLLNHKSSTDENVIHYAVRYGKIELVNYLLNYIKDNFEDASSDILKAVLLNSTSSTGENVIHYAVKYGEIELVKYLLYYIKDNFEDASSDILKVVLLNNTSSTDENLIHYAVRYGKIELVKYLLNYIKDNFEDASSDILKVVLLNHKSSTDENVIHYAVRYGKIELVNYLLNYIKDNFEDASSDILKAVLLNSTSSTGENVIHYAVKYGKIELVKYLLNYIKDNFEDASSDILKAVLLNSTSSTGENVIHYAVKYGEIELVNYLLNYIKYNFEDASSDILIALLLNPTYSTGQNVIHYAVRYGEIELLNYILNCIKDNFEDASSDILKAVLLNSTSSTGENVIHYAVRFGKIELVNYLLNYIKDNFEDASSDILKAVLLNTTFSTGENVIHYAVRYGEIELVIYLLNYIKDNFEDESSEILAVLLNHTSSTGENVVDYAFRYDMIDLAKYLSNSIKYNFEDASPGTLNF